MAPQIRRESPKGKRSALVLAVFIALAPWADAQAAAAPGTMSHPEMGVVLVRGGSRNVPLWIKHSRQNTAASKWRAKCAQGRARARNNPASAAVHPPACTRT
jgi:hypothetical protein